MILFVVGDVCLASGGVTQVVLKYLEIMKRSNKNFRLVTSFNYYLTNQIVIEEYGANNFTILKRQKNLARLVAGHFFKKGDWKTVILHGFWSPIVMISMLRFYISNTEYSIFPHGMLEPWSFEQSPIKKRAVFYLLGRFLLRNAVAVFALSDCEKKSLERLGLENVKLVPFPIASSNILRPRTRNSSGSCWKVLFLSRLHYKKGVDLLLSVIPKIDSERLRFGFAGRDEGSYRAKIDALEDGRVTYHGLVVGDEKEQLFNDYDFVILPSYSENFGVVIVEALERGLPVVVSDATPWTDLQSAGCGIVIEATEEGIIGALEQVMRLNVKQYNRMSERGRGYVKKLAETNQDQFLLNSIGCYEEAS